MIPIGYTVLEDGRIIGSRGQVRKLELSPQGYLRVTAWVDGRVQSLFVHRLVCEAFHGAPPSVRHQARHLDGNKLNNCASNLAWGTSKDNHGDMDRHGTRVDNSGEKSGHAKLTWVVVAEARKRYGAGGVSVRALAAEFGVSGRAMHKALIGETWRVDEKSQHPASLKIASDYASARAQT